MAAMSAPITSKRDRHECEKRGIDLHTRKPNLTHRLSARERMKRQEVDARSDGPEPWTHVPEAGRSAQRLDSESVIETD